MNKVDVKISSPSKDVLLIMLRFALLEIRATDKVELANALADIFHVLPTQLIGDCDENTIRESYDKIIQKSEKYKFKGYILELQKTAEKSLSK
jgi:hypothetical protein